MFDDYSAGLPLTVVVILENLSVAWIYGTKRYSYLQVCVRVCKSKCKIIQSFVLLFCLRQVHAGSRGHVGFPTV